MQVGRRSAGVVLVLSFVPNMGCSDRKVTDLFDREELKLEACEGFCEMIDTCDIDLSEYQDPGEPTDCVERCMTLLPMLHEDNQCGSREIIGLRCLGALDCEGYAAHRAGFPTLVTPPDWSAPCITETIQGCSIFKPFDLEEDIPVPESYP